MRKRSARRTLVAATGALALGLVVVSVAYACTVIQGQSTVSPTSGGPGASITVGTTSANVRPFTTYKIGFLNYASQADAMQTCMPASGVSHPTVQLGTTVRSSSKGVIAPVTRTIPTDIHPSDPGVNHGAHNSNSTNGGPALVCHSTNITPNAGGYATNAAVLTIVGGTP